ncbi:MAG: RNA-binding domain-containing protein [Sphaerochaeta sp.]
MDNSLLRKYLSKGEGVDVEFKECNKALNQSVFDTVCSFSNRLGGYVFLGVKDSGEVIGVEIDSIQRIKRDFANNLNNPQKINPPLYIQLKEFVYQDKVVLYAYIPESSSVHTLNGTKIYDRNEDGDYNITSNQNLIDKMYARKSNRNSEDRIIPYAKESWFDIETVKMAKELANNVNSKNLWALKGEVEIVKSSMLYKHDAETGIEGYTQAALLLFGKDEYIGSVLPYYHIDCLVRKENLDRFDDREVVECNLIRAYTMIMDFIAKHLSKGFYIDENTQSVSPRDKLFKEAVVNFLIHREYSDAYISSMVIEKDKVTFKNAANPSYIGKVDIDDFNPEPKNPTIARVFRLMGLADELGSGFRNIKKYCKIYSDSTPVVLDGDVFTLELPLRSDKKVEEDKTSVKEKILDYVANNHEISNKDVRDSFGLEKSRATELLSELMDENLLRREGSGRGTKYVPAKG